MTLMDGWIADYGYVVFNLPWVGIYFPDSNFSQEKIMASESGEEVSAPTLILKSETIIGKWSARNLSCEYHYSFKLWFPSSWWFSMENNSIRQLPWYCLFHTDDFWCESIKNWTVLTRIKRPCNPLIFFSIIIPDIPEFWHALQI